MSVDRIKVDQVEAFRSKDGILHATKEAAVRRDAERLLAKLIYAGLMRYRESSIDGNAMASRADCAASDIMLVADDAVAILSEYLRSRGDAA